MQAKPDKFQTNNVELGTALDELSKLADLTKTQGARIYELLASGNDSAFETFRVSLQGELKKGRLRSFELIYTEAKRLPKLKEYLTNCATDRAKLSAELTYARQAADEPQLLPEGGGAR
jgi:hypothetical protein